MEILAAVGRTTDQPFAVERLVLDPPRPDEILVRVEAAGICHTDLLAKGGGMPIRLPAVLGHEGAGVVEQVGSGIRKVKPGDRVMLTFRSCGVCRRCEDGDPAYCYAMPRLNYRGSRPDGTTPLRLGDSPIAGNFFGQSSFATYCLAYERNTVVLPPDIPFAVGAILGCAVQTGVGSILRSMACPAGSTLMIVGGGPVGLSAVLGARIAECETIIMVEPHSARRDLALAFGATGAFDPAHPDEIKKAVAAGPRRSLDFVLDTSGVPAMLDLAMHLLGPRGTLGMVGVPPAGTALPGDPQRVLTLGQSIRGIIEGDSDPDLFLPELFQLYRDGRLPVDRMIASFPLEAINEAVGAQKRGECIKVVLTMDPGGKGREGPTLFSNHSNGNSSDG